LPEDRCCSSSTDLYHHASLARYSFYRAALTEPEAEVVEAHRDQMKTAVAERKLREDKEPRKEREWKTASALKNVSFYCRREAQTKGADKNPSMRVRETAP